MTRRTLFGAALIILGFALAVATMFFGALASLGEALGATYAKGLLLALLSMDMVEASTINAPGKTEVVITLPGEYGIYEPDGAIFGLRIHAGL